VSDPASDPTIGLRVVSVPDAGIRFTGKTHQHLDIVLARVGMREKHGGVVSTSNDWDGAGCPAVEVCYGDEEDDDTYRLQFPTMRGWEVTMVSYESYALQVLFTKVQKPSGEKS
jgi:hypothetical protein